jgi:hypothetical protein
VSIFTALINLVVDFLFVDILFAPTMDSKKQEKNLKVFRKAKFNKISSPLPPNSQGEENKQAINQTRRAEETTPTPSPMVPHSSSNFQRVKRMTLQKIQSGNLELETTRVLPSSTLQAHQLATLSANEIIDDRVSAIRNTLVRQETIRRTSSKRRASFMKNIPLNEMSVDDQFVDLSVDIAEQRKELKRSQQEKYDEMWG